MLRISAQTEAGPVVTIGVEGALAGEWVPVLQAECHRHLDAWTSVELDLVSLRFVDQDGVAMVRGLMARGVRVVRASPLVSSLLGLAAAPDA